MSQDSFFLCICLRGIFWVFLQKNLWMCLVTTGSASGSTSACPWWLWSRETLPAYWPVCKFDLTLSVLFCCCSKELTSSFFQLLSMYWPASLLTTLLEPVCQYIAIALRILILCKFHFPSVVQCYLACASIKYLVNHTVLWNYTFQN